MRGGQPASPAHDFPPAGRPAEKIPKILLQHHHQQPTDDDDFINDFTNDFPPGLVGEGGRRKNPKNTTIFYLKEILSKEIPAERRRGRSLSDKNPRRKQWARKTSAEDPRKTCLSKEIPGCSRNMLAEHATEGCRGRSLRSRIPEENNWRGRLPRMTSRKTAAEDARGRSAEDSRVRRSKRIFFR